MKKVLFCLFISFIAFYGCAEKSEVTNNSGNTTKVELNLQGLPVLGDTLVYTVWLSTQEKQGNGYIPVNKNLGIIQPQGGTFTSTYYTNLSVAYYLSSFFVSIEPKNEDSLNQTKVSTVFLRGEFSANDAELEIPDARLIKTSTCKYMIYTPTDPNNGNGKSGIWFVDTLNGNKVKGLTLPAPKANWSYEGFVVLNNQPLSTGKFTNVFGGADLEAKYSGTGAAPAYPGEDFLQNAPSGLTFPADLSGAKVYLTVNLKIANSNIFSGKIFSADIPANVSVGIPYSLQPAGEALPGGRARVVVD